MNNYKKVKSFHKPRSGDNHENTEAPPHKKDTS